MLQGQLIGTKCTECRASNINFLETYKIFDDSNEIVSMIYLRVFKESNSNFYSCSVTAVDNTYLYDENLKDLPPAEFFVKEKDHPGKTVFQHNNFQTMQEADQESLNLLGSAINWLTSRLGKPIELI